MKADFATLSQRVTQLQAELVNAKEELEAMRLAELRKVRLRKNDLSMTLTFNGRILNARKNRHGRLTVKEGKRVLVSEYFGSVHDLRFAVAQGVI
jgi:hypothetical protein